MAAQTFTPAPETSSASIRWLPGERLPGNRRRSRWTRVKLTRVRPRSTAPNTTTADRASCAATSGACSHRQRPTAVAVRPERGARPMCVARMAGASPNRIAVIAESAAAKTIRRPSGEDTSESTRDVPRTWCARNPLAHRPATSPAVPPAAASIRLSVRHCPETEGRWMRRATGECRRPSRAPGRAASMRLAIFAQVTSDTTATIAASARSASE